MRVEATELDGVFELTPVRHDDARGWFSETWNRQRMLDHGLDIDWVQDNDSLSAQAGTVRAIHFQIEPFAQDKLVRVVAGRIFDVAVDLRRGSDSFGSWTARELSAEQGNQLLVPKGFGHGFMTLTTNCHVAYKVSAPYDSECDRAVAWDDPTIGIDWPTVDVVHLSDRDRAAPPLTAAPTLFA